MLQSEVDVNLDGIACTPTPAKSKEVMLAEVAANNAAEQLNAANKDADQVNKPAAEAKDKSAKEKPKDADKDADKERKDETSQKDGDKDDANAQKSPKLESTQRSTVQPKKIPSKKGAARRGVTCDEASEPAENKEDAELDPTQPSD
ncbi:hypothetical protein AAVH_36825 [Aphelenchoides avenae]|nr:hypothetical protein AAVH_36825 [Aphelenchus avenae]